MHSFRALLIAAIAVIGSCVWWIRRPAGKKKIRFTRIEPENDLECGPKTFRRNSGTGALTAISASELCALAARDRNYILVDVASDGPSTFGGARGSFVLSIAPGKLPDVLEWLPTDRTVVFRGISEAERALIERSACMSSSKPRCVLTDLPVAVEAL